ncbi:hypothetical protein EXIGLDRAFT_770855 [Exidia glandulosa HHB12029]|uniref:Peptidase M43 pregnancy-associated plasma-A domain-containing protein n=1 Tax=Exidia glandulosa HHB12029 TaxID=1314781 RepID=A0A166ABP8_EXIGL|nr:hypothetical protein EXIGLDRAFT_770855 [Exidia glandulosa HHB12029]
MHLNALVFLSVLGLVAAQWCGCENADSTTCVESPQDYNRDERIDCGPYIQRRSCSDVVTGDGCGTGDASLSLTTGIDNDDPADVNPPDPDFSADELDNYKTLELELLADILKNEPLYPDEGEQKLDLPYCGMLSDDAATSRRDIPVYASDLYKRGWGSIFKGLKWPTLSSGPKKPVFTKKPGPPNVRVVFNVFATNYTTQDKVTDELLDTAVAELNSAYQRMNISFYRDSSIYRFTEPSDDELRRFTQHVRGGSDDDAFNNAYMMREAHRHGGKDVLHVYVLESIRRTNAVLNGFCFFPNTKGVDGCAVAMDAMTGISHINCDTTSRGTLTHEAGHWFGLKHTHDEIDDDVCGGDNEIDVIPQFPSNGRFCDTQHPCSKGKSPSVQSKTNVRMTNYMSYAFSRGSPYVADVGPWVAEQKSKAWTNFYNLRVGISGSFKRDSPAGSLYSRLVQYREQQSRAFNLTLSARGILSSRPGIRDELLAICQTPWSDPDPSIDAAIPDKDNDSSKIPEDDGSTTTPGTGGTTNPDKGTGKGGSSGTGKSSGGNGSGTGTGTGTGTGSGNGSDGTDSGDGTSTGRAGVLRPNALFAALVSVLAFTF